jgi:hypothetical protein
MAHRQILSRRIVYHDNSPFFVFWAIFPHVVHLGVDEISHVIHMATEHIDILEDADTNCCMEISEIRRTQKMLFFIIQT